MFENLNVVRILGLGSAGLCFLLSLLVFRLIQKEQDRSGDPRGGILRAIYVFMAVNILAASLVSAADYLAPKQKTLASQGELTSSDYLVDYTAYLVDLTKWTPSTLGPVEVTRSDYVRKVADTQEPFIIHFFTSGSEVKCEPLTHGTQPSFTGPWKNPGDNNLHYDYRLPIGHEPVTYSEFVSSRFTFTNGFSNKENEWWQANVAYPARTLSVVFKFPPNKPALKLEASRIMGINGKELISDNLPISPDGGYTYMWVGLHLEGKTRVEFDWEW